MTAYQNPELLSILNATSKVFGIPIKELIQRGRRKDAAEARFAVFLAARKSTRLTLHSIGEMLNRDHGTVMYGVYRAESLSQVDSDYRVKFESIMAIVKKEKESPKYWPTV